MNRRRRSHRFIAAAVLAAALLIAAGGGIGWAHFSSAAPAAPTVSTLALGDPDTASASTTDSCATITITWTAATNADSYRVQVKQDAGAWTDLQTETANVTQIVDPSGRTGVTVTYRVYSRHASSDWEGAAAATSAPLAC